MSLFSSDGIKRKLASILSVLFGLAQTIPQLAPLLPILTTLAGALGGVGVIHAAGAGTLSKYTLLSLSAALSFISVLAPYIKELNPLVDTLTHLSSIIGALAAGGAISSEEEQ